MAAYARRVDLTSALRDEAATIGLTGFGVCAAEPFVETAAAIAAARESGRSGKLRFTYTEPAATDITRSFPWARRLVVGAWSYLEAARSPGPPQPGTGRVARFATADHYRELRERLAALATLLVTAGHRAEILIDDNRLVDRAAAVRAGVGWWGKSTMVLAPGAGPWLVLGSIVTDAELATTAPMVRDCGTCVACLPACPTGALVEPGVLDATRCLAYWAQTGGSIPLEFRSLMGDRIYGCDDCLDACPPGHRAMEGASGAGGRHGLAELLALDDRSLLARFEHFYVPKRNPRFLRRNALVALGNAGGPEATAVAAGYLGHPDPMLREHAAWALGSLGGPMAWAALRLASTGERHADVRREISGALARA